MNVVTPVGFLTLLTNGIGVSGEDGWILATGFWNDYGLWMDEEFWQD